MTPSTASRRGVTLIELLVVMAILTALLALALMVVPNVNQQNAVVKGTSEVQAAFKTAQAMAAQAQMPRGVRFVVNNGFVANELQYIEMPLLIVSNPQALVAGAADPQAQNNPYGPRCEISYTLTGASANGGPPPQNTITARHCYLRGLPLTQGTQIVAGTTLMLPTLGSFSQIISANWIAPSAPLTSTAAAPGPFTYTSPQSGLVAADLEVILQIYPDQFLGTATAFRTFHFGIYTPPIPLLAESTVPLPPGIVADLQVSYPPLNAPGQNYDVLFSPAGPTISSPNIAANTNVYIWIRDNTKITNPGAARQTSMNPPDFGGNYPAFVDAFRRSGEQYLVGIRSGGLVGTAPVNRPTPPASGGSFANYAPFAFAQQRLDK
jgi:prepilin-type N-terminal cleavage/methylation domain-containing protein